MKVIEKDGFGKIVQDGSGQLYYAPKMTALLKHVSGGRQIYHKVVNHGANIFDTIEKPNALYDGEFYHYTSEIVYLEA